MQILNQTSSQYAIRPIKLILVKFSIKELLFLNWYVNFVEIVLKFVNE